MSTGPKAKRRRRRSKGEPGATPDAAPGQGGSRVRLVLLVLAMVAFAAPFLVAAP